MKIVKGLIQHDSVTVSEPCILLKHEVQGRHLSVNWLLRFTIIYIYRSDL